MRKDIIKLLHCQREALIVDPLGKLCAMGGCFKFNSRGAWTTIDAGYSLDTHKQPVMASMASPVVELMAAWGLEHARPYEIELTEASNTFWGYTVWGGRLPPVLARAALGAGLVTIPCHHFRFLLAKSGENKVVCFAQKDLAA